MTPTEERWLAPGVRGIGAASFLADVGHEIPTALLPNLLTVTLGALAAALGLIEGVADGLAGAARLAGGAIADDPRRRRAQAVGGYTTTAVLSSLIGAATALWQVAATVASVPAGRLGDRRGTVLVLGVGLFGLAYAGFSVGGWKVTSSQTEGWSPAGLPLWRRGGLPNGGWRSAAHPR